MDKPRMSLVQLGAMVFVIVFVMCLAQFAFPTKPLWATMLLAGLSAGFGQYLARKFIPLKDAQK